MFQQIGYSNLVKIVVDFTWEAVYNIRRLCYSFENTTIYSMAEFEKGDTVTLLDRPLGHASKIKGVIVGILTEDLYNVLLTNGFGKGKIKKVRTFEIIKEEN